MSLIRCKNNATGESLQSKDQDLAAKWKDHPGMGQDEATKTRRQDKDDITGRFVKGNKQPGGGRPLGSNNDSVKAIKQYMAELLDDPGYRAKLTRRIKAGELPQIELFLLTKAIGKPKEEIEVTANVPLFALPTSFVLKEDDVEAEDVKVLEAGESNGADQIRE
jgi:hypothetical protein